MNVHEATVPGAGASKGPGIAVAGAASPLAPPLEQVDASDIRGRREGLLQVVRGINEELSRLGAAASDPPTNPL